MSDINSLQNLANSVNKIYEKIETTRSCTLSHKNSNNSKASECHSKFEKLVRKFCKFAEEYKFELGEFHKLLSNNIQISKLKELQRQNEKERLEILQKLETLSNCNSDIVDNLTESDNISAVPSINYESKYDSNPTTAPIPTQPIINFAKAITPSKQNIKKVVKNTNVRKNTKVQKQKQSKPIQKPAQKKANNGNKVNKVHKVHKVNKVNKVNTVNTVNKVKVNKVNTVNTVNTVNKVNKVKVNKVKVNNVKVNNVKVNNVKVNNVKVNKVNKVNNVKVNKVNNVKVNNVNNVKVNKVNNVKVNKVNKTKKMEKEYIYSGNNWVFNGVHKSATVVFIGNLARDIKQSQINNFVMRRGNVNISQIIEIRIMDGTRGGKYALVRFRNDVSMNKINTFINKINKENDDIKKQQEILKNKGNYKKINDIVSWKKRIILNHNKFQKFYKSEDEMFNDPNADHILFIRNFDILNRNCHRELTNKLSKCGELYEDISIRVGHFGEPYCVAIFKYINDAIYCCNSDIEFNGRMLEIRYSRKDYNN